MDRSSQINTFNRFARVSRETINSLIIYEKMLLKANKDLNLVGKSTINQIWTRHFLDSFQVIDLIDKNDDSITDIGTGAGFPGVVLSIAAYERKIPLKIKLIEKSKKKIRFLNELISKLNLNVVTLEQNVFENSFKFTEKNFVARAFKPLKVILELIHNKANNWKKVFVFQGKTGESELLQASKIWDIEYKKRVSVTSGDSFVLEINKLKKK